MAYTTKTIGVVRFSVLTTTYYTERFDTVDAIAEHLFSPARMALRFDLFEKLCLPSLARQTDQDFECVVITSSQMPAEYLGRLADLLEPLPNFHCFPVDVGAHYGLLRTAYDLVPVDGCSHRILFRLDDDDAVDLEFVARNKRIAAALLDLQGPKDPTIIACNKGFYVRWQDGENEVFDARERAPLSTGAALLAPTDFRDNPYRFNHRAFPQHFNTYSSISVPGFIRTIHGDNKSNPSQLGKTHTLPPERTRRQLRRHFGVSIDMLKGL